MKNMPEFDPRSYAKRQIDAPGLGDDCPCERCGAVALDTGPECDECGHDNYFAVTGHAFVAAHQSAKPGLLS